MTVSTDEDSTKGAGNSSSGISGLFENYTRARIAAGGKLPIKPPAVSSTPPHPHYRISANRAGIDAEVLEMWDAIDYDRLGTDQYNHPEGVMNPDSEHNGASYEFDDVTKTLYVLVSAPSGVLPKGGVLRNKVETIDSKIEEKQ